MANDTRLIGYSFEVANWDGNQHQQCPVSVPPSEEVYVAMRNPNGNGVRVGQPFLNTLPSSAGVKDSIYNVHGEPRAQSFRITDSGETIGNNTGNLFRVGENHFVPNPPTVGVRESIRNNNASFSEVGNTQFASDLPSAVREAGGKISGQLNAQSSLVGGSTEAMNNVNEISAGVGVTLALSQPITLASLVPDDSLVQCVGKPFVGMEFDTIETSHAYWENYASNTGFRGRIRNSRRTKQGLITTRSYVCAKEGIRAHDPRRTTDNHRAAVRCGCGVIMNVNFIKEKGVYRVSSFIEDHNHGLDGEEGYLDNSAYEQSRCKPVVGMEFDTLKASQVFWQQYADDVGFGSRIGITRQGKRDKVVKLRTYVCSREGDEVHNPRYMTRRGDKRCRCGVHMAVVLVKEKGTYRVEAFSEEHNHRLDGKPRAKEARQRRGTNDPVGVGSSSNGKPRAKRARHQCGTNDPGVGSSAGEDPLPNLTNGRTFDFNSEFDCNTNISQLIADENEVQRRATSVGNGSGPTIREGRMGILFSEFMQLAYRAVMNDEVFEGVRRLIREGHCLADLY